MQYKHVGWVMEYRPRGDRRWRPMLPFVGKTRNMAVERFRYTQEEKDCLAPEWPTRCVKLYVEEKP